MKTKRLSVVALILVSISLQACSTPEEKSAEYIDNANILFQEGDLKKALIEYKNALQINQNLPEAWYGLARVHERRQEWKKVFAVLNKVRELAPQHTDGRIMLGQMLLASGQIDLALADAIEIREFAPDDARSHTLMGAIQFRLGNFEGALHDADKALSIDAAHAEAMLVRARVFIAEHRYEDALSQLNDGIEKNPKEISFYLTKIEVHTEMEDSKAIEQVYLDLISQFPDVVNYKAALARHYAGEKNINAGEEILLQIADSSEASVDDRLNFVKFKRRYRSFDEAIARLKLYIATDGKEYRYQFLLGELYESGNQKDEALKVFEAIVAQDGVQPMGLEARNRIALIEMRADNHQRASTLIEEVLKQDKNNENALLLRAGFQISNGEFDDAVISARTVLRDNPDSIKALGLLGQAYDANGSTVLAIESYSRAFQLSPGTPVIANKLVANLLRQNNVSLADEVMQESLASGNRSIEALNLFAQVKLSLGEWEKAELVARELQKLEGQEVVSQQLLGVIYQGLERQEASIEAFKRAHELAPESAQPVVALVRTYLRYGNVDEAKNFLHSILTVDSDNATAHLLLGQISIAEGASAEAISHFEKAINSDPEQNVGYRRLAAMYLGQEDVENAIVVIDRGLAALPDSLVLSISLASLYETRGEFEKAIEIYQTILKKNNDSLVAKNNLASLLTDRRSDQASLDQARAIAAELKTSEIPQFRDTYAWSSVVAGTNLEEAILILEGIIRENEKVAVYNYHLGEAYRRNKESEKAVAYLSKAIELADSDSSISQKARQSLQQIQ